MLRTSAYPARAAFHSGETATALALAVRWRGLARQLAARVRLWRRRARSRRALAGLSDHQLKDIGICRFDAKIESAKPFWRP